MILLADTNDKLQLVTSAAATVDVVCSYAEYSTSFALNGLGKQLTAITTATTTDILAAPGASTIRNLKQMTVRNKDASVSVDVTLVFDDNGTDYEIHKATLAPGYMLEFVEGVGFFVIAPNVNDSRLITGVEPDDAQRIFQSAIGKVASGTFVWISGTAYYVYVGRAVQALTVKFVEALLTTNGAGTQTLELGLFSTPTAPSKSTQTLTKLAATGTVDSVTAGATKVFRNTSSFAQAVPAGTHLWAACRAAMATTQPTTAGLCGDWAQAHILTTTGGGALTGLSSASGTIPTVSNATICPDLRITLD